MPAKILKIVGFVLSSLLLLLLLAFALLQTGFAKQQIADLIASSLTDETTTAQVEDLRGFLPFDIKLGRFSLADEQSPWLVLEDVRFDWSFAALFLARVQINEISAARILVDHLPPPKEEPEEEEEKEPFEIPTSLPEMPGFIPTIVVKKLAFEKIELGEPVVGEAMSLALNGQVRTVDNDSAIEAKIDIKRLDQETLNADLAAILGLYPLALDLNLSAIDTGGLVGRLAGRPEMTEVRLKLTGKGPLSNWQGTLSTEAASIARLESRLTFGITEQSYLGFTGTLFPAKDLLPVDTIAMLGKRTDIDLQVKATDPKKVEVSPLMVSNALLNLSSRIGIDLDAQTVTAKLELLIDQLKRLDEIAGVSLGGNARLDLAVDGPMQQPGVKLDLQSKGLAVDQFSIEQMTNSITLKLLKPLTEGFDGAIHGDGRLQGMVQGNTPLPEHSLNWKLDAHVPDRGAIDLADFDVVGKYTKLNLVANFDPQKLVGEGKLRLAIDQLSALAPESGVRGEAKLDADFTMQQGAEQIVVTIAGGLDKLAGLPKGIDELLGRRMDLSLFADVRPKGATKISDLSVKAKGLELTGNLDADMATKALGGALLLEVPRLDLLQAAVGQPLAGSLKLNTQISGSTDAPEIVFMALLKRFQFTDLKFDAVRLDATALDVIKKPNGRVALAMKQPRQNITAGVHYALDGDRLSLTELGLRAPATEFKGRFDIDLKKTLIDGELKGGISDLKRLREWLPLTLAGNLTLDTVLRHRNGRQSVRLKAEAHDIAGDFGTLKAATADADVSDLFGNAAVQVSADVTDFVQGDTRLDRATVEAHGKLSDLALKTALAGHHLKDFSIETQAQFGQKPRGIRVVLKALQGHFGEASIRLERPTQFQMKGKNVRLEPLMLTFGEARLNAEVIYGPRKVDGKIDAFVPLDMLKEFEIVDMDGEVKADVTFSGTPTAPGADIAVNLSDFRMNDEALAKVPSTNVTVRARLAKRRLVADVKAENSVLEKPILAHAELPVALSLEPFHFDLPKNEPLSAQLQAALQLERIAEVIELEDQAVAGRFNLALDVKGNLDQPQVTGDITLRDGYYENGATATLLKDITLTIQGHQKRITLEELSANDGVGGSLNGKGWVSMDGDKDFPFDMKITLDHMQLANSKELTANAGADISLSGDMAAALLAGKVKINEVHFTLPSKVGGGPSVPEMKVEEVYAKAQPESKEKAPIKPPIAVTLDLTIDFPQDVFVRGHGLESEWMGHLTVTGKATDPKVVGRIESKQGRLDLLGYRFKFERGIIDFDGASPPIPTLDIETSTMTKDGFKAMILITGSATEPKLKLSSDPPLPQDEVLAHVLFGKDATNITPIEALQLANVVSMLAGGGNFDAFNSFRDAMGLDTLSMGGDGFSGTSVKAGKYLTDKIYMEVEKGLTQDFTTTTVEVELFPEIKLDSEFDQNSNGALGLKWKRDY
jgi:translocation and assembly module TamB